MPTDPEPLTIVKIANMLKDCNSFFFGEVWRSGFASTLSRLVHLGEPTYLFCPQSYGKPLDTTA